jgi:hypothetical protein
MSERQQLALIKQLERERDKTGEKRKLTLFFLGTRLKMHFVDVDKTDPV